MEVILTVISGLLALIGFYWAFIEGSNNSHKTH